MDTYDTSGRPDQPPILLIHGSVLSRKMWLPQLDALGNEFFVIAPDLPGHGARAGDPFHFDSAIEGMLADASALTNRRFLVVGSSLGGYVAMGLAQRHPERVAALAVSGATVNFRGPTGLYVRLVGWMLSRVVSESWMDRRNRDKVAALYPPGLSTAAEAQLAVGVFSRAAGQSFLELAGKDFRAMLGAFPGEVLILNGELDGMSRRGEAAFLAAAGQATSEPVPGAGHACSLQQAELFTDSVRRFARRVFKLSTDAAPEPAT